MIILPNNRPAAQLAEKALASIATANLFTITGGPVAVTDILGEVTTVFQTQANNMKLVAATVDLCAVVDVTAAAVGSSLSVTGAVADAMVVTAVFVVAGQGKQLAQGTYVIGPTTISMNCSATNTGAVRWMCRWYPLVEGAKLHSV